MNTVFDSLDSAERLAKASSRGRPLVSQGPRADSLGKKAQGLVESAIGNHPMTAFGLALCAGVVLGWWIKRR